MGFFDKLFGGKSKDENTAKFTNQSKTVLTPLQGKVLAQTDEIQGRENDRHDAAGRQGHPAGRAAG